MPAGGESRHRSLSNEKIEIMAKQKGIVKLKGTIEDIAFYKTIDGYVARAKGGIDPERIKNDPKFARTRENNAEFGSAAKSAKQLRRTLWPMLKRASDPRMIGRLVKVMTRIKTLDITNARGERNVGAAIGNAEVPGILKNFEFNRNSELGAVLQLIPEVDTVTGTITISDFIPLEDLTAPVEATHVRFRGAWVKINFATASQAVKYTNTVHLPINAAQTDVILTPPAVPAGTGISLHVMVAAFFQEINGIQYPLQNGSHNAMAILEIV
jgi:hypothetical protein